MAGPPTPLPPPLWMLGEASGWGERLLEPLQGGVTDGSTIKWTSSLRSAGTLAIFTQTANGSRGGGASSLPADDGDKLIVLRG